MTNRLKHIPDTNFYKLFIEPNFSPKYFAKLFLFRDKLDFLLALENKTGKSEGSTRSFVFNSQEDALEGCLGSIYLLANNEYNGVYEACIVACDFVRLMEIALTPEQLNVIEPNENKRKNICIASYTENIFRQIVDVRNKDFFIPQ